MLIKSNTRIGTTRKTVLHYGPFNRGIVNWCSTPPLEGYCRYPKEAPRTSRNKFHDWLEKTIEETTETKDNNPETIEVRVFKNK